MPFFSPLHQFILLLCSELQYSGNQISKIEVKAKDLKDGSRGRRTLQNPQRGQSFHAEMIPLRNQHKTFLAPTAEEVAHLLLCSLPGFLLCVKVGGGSVSFSSPSLGSLEVCNVSKLKSLFCGSSSNSIFLLAFFFWGGGIVQVIPSQKAEVSFSAKRPVPHTYLWTLTLISCSERSRKKWFNKDYNIHKAAHDCL